MFVLKNMFISICITIVLILSISASAQAGVSIPSDSISISQSKFISISEMFIKHKIKRMDISWVPDGVMTVTRITPDAMDKDGWYKLSIGASALTDYRSILPRMLQSTKVSATNWNGEVRYCAKWYDYNDKCVMSIYIARNLHNCIIDGINANISTELTVWIRDTFIYKITPPPYPLLKAVKKRSVNK